MLGTIAKKIFGSSNDRRLKTYAPKVRAINALEPELAALSDDELKARTAAFRAELAAGKTLDDLLVPAFAVVREAAKRTLGQRHFDVQLIGGMVLHEGAIAEMKTGEGKTLVATLAVYLNALAAKGVHVVTVNDYLARRDADWMGQIYRFLGLTVGIIVHGLDDDERRASYACDITYGTNNEYGFDYLRDNMKYEIAQMTQRGHSFAIVDEVDSILVDEARTPLIISGPSDDRSDLYMALDDLIPKLAREDYDLDEKQRAVSLNESGNERLEQLMLEAGILTEGSTLYDGANITLVHHVNQALRAHKLFHKDKDYIVRNDEVMIIDEFTGRMMPGRRYSDGQHQALEAKERVQVQPENVTLASITFQNYFRLYGKLAGMTGTAATEADEFAEIYRLEVVEIPTNRPVARLDEDDEVFRTATEKYRAIVAEIGRAHARMQPVLVGTASIEKSELIAELMKEAGYRLIDFSDPKALARLYEGARTGTPTKQFAVLNARFHEQEAYIVAEAGVPGAITVATNMAGRGTDIKLGGNLEMRLERESGGGETEVEDSVESAIRTHIEAGREAVLGSGEPADPAAGRKSALPGGLYIIGTERHESRRIDNQLRGRSGRQGDPGRSKFYLSLQDDLMRIFGSERMDSVLTRLGLKEDEAIIHPWINRAIEKAQQKVEARNFDMRKNILKYDNVMNDQRKSVFESRREFMAEESVRDTITEMRHGVIDDVVGVYMPEGSYPEQWNTAGLKEAVQGVLNLDLPVDDWAKEEGIADEEVVERLRNASDASYAERVEKNTPDVMNYVEKQVLLQSFDHLWREHLVTLDHLRQVIGWRGYAQRDPLNEYKSEAFDMYNQMVGHLREQVTGQLMRVDVVFQEPGAEGFGPDGLGPEGSGPAGLGLAGLGPAGLGPDGLPAMFAQHLDPATGENEFGSDHATGSSGGAGPAVGFAAREMSADTAVLERDPNDPASWGRVGRNQACPCGSGKKYKHCHGRLAGKARRR